MGVLLTTVNTVTIDDLGGRTFTHPLVSYDLTEEYEYSEIRGSSNLGAKLDAGDVEIVNDGNVISSSTELKQIEPVSEYKNNTFIPPRLTTIERNALTPEGGGVIYNTDTKAIEWYNSSQWNSAGGVGSTPLFPPAFLYVTQQVVQTMSDFPAPVGRYITIVDTVCVVDAIELDFSGYTFILEGRSAIVGINQNVNSLVSSEDNVTFFMSTGNNVFMNAIEIYMNGDNQTVWEHIGTTGNESFELNQFVVYGGGSPFATGTNSKMGYIETIRQGFMGTMFFWGVDDGFECAGHWVGGGLRISNTLWLGCSGKFYYSSPTNPVIFDTRFSSNANVQPPLGSIAYDFPETSFTYDGQYQLQNGNASGAGVMVTDWNGKSPAFNPKANFKNNNGIQNTFIGVEFKNNLDTTTLVAAKDVWYDMNLQTINIDPTWFEEINGVLRYLSGTPFDFFMTNTITLAGKSGDIIEVRVMHNIFGGGDVELNYAPLELNGTLAQGKSASTPLNTTGRLNKDDTLRLQGRNVSGARDYTALKNLNSITKTK